MKYLFFIFSLYPILLLGASPSELIPLPQLHNGHYWYLSTKNPHSDNLEYYPQGEDPKNWTEKLTVHQWNPLNKQQLNDYPKALCHYLKEQFQSKVYFRIIQRQKNGVFFEWEAINSPIGSQHEWFKILNHKDYCMAIRYTCRDCLQLKDKRPYWENFLAEIKLKKTEKNPSSPMPHDSPLVTFHNPKLHCTYLIPANWKITLDRSSHTFHKDPNKRAEFLISSNLLEGELIKMIEKRIQEYQQSLIFGYPQKEKLQAISPNTYLLPFESKQHTSGKQIQYTLVFISHENLLYQISFSCLRECATTLQPLIEEIGKSLKYSEKFPT